MHVPEKHLPIYRDIVAVARKADTLGNIYSGKGEYADASRMWALASQIRSTAIALRVPGKNDKEQGSASNRAADQGASTGDSEPSPGDS